MENWPNGAGAGAGGDVSGAGRNIVLRNRKSKNKRSRRKGDISGRHTSSSDSAAASRGGGGCSGSNNNHNKRHKGPPSSPQTKVVIRNIGEVTKHGSVKKVIELVRSIIHGANEKLEASTSRVIKLDEQAVEGLIQEEDAVMHALDDGEVINSSGETDGKVVLSSATDLNDREEENKPPACSNDGETSRGSVQATSSVALSSIEGMATNLGARMIYVDPPKKTRRRGVMPGCAYLVISGPVIQAKDPYLGASALSTDTAIAKTEELAADLQVMKANQLEKADYSGVNHGVADAASRSSDHGAATVASVDYSREIAIGRFLVIQAIEAMQAHAAEDRKAEQMYAGSIVEVAMSGKTYKQQYHRRDRREGTVEHTADYKCFIKGAAKVKEERSARPKPCPGGGAATTQSTGTSSMDVLEHGNPLAALVEHIRNKRVEASIRKKSRKKVKEITNKETPFVASGKASRKKKRRDGNRREGGQKECWSKDGKKKERSKGKKSGHGGTSLIQESTPTALLKSGCAESGVTSLLTSSQCSTDIKSIGGFEAQM